MSATPNSPVDTISARAAALTARNSTEGASPAKPPKVAAQSPIHELLIEEVAASLPPEIARKMREASPVSAAQDWIAVATMYNWIKSDRTLSGQFIAEVGNRPAEAALALAKAIARTLDPRPPDPQLRQLDRCGLVLETGLVMVVLFSRGLLMSCILVFLLQIAPSVELPLAVRQIMLPDFAYLAWNAVPAWRMALAFIAATCWLAAENFWAPRCLESMRALPLRWLRARRYAHWRTDALHSIWGAHAVTVQSLLLYRVVAEAIAARRTIAVDPSAGMWLLLCTVVSVFAFVATIVAWQRTFERDRHPQSS